MSANGRWTATWKYTGSGGAAQPDNAHAHLWKGQVAKMRSVATRATEPLDVWLAETNAAIASDRNFSAAFAEKGHYMIATGRAPEAFEFLNRRCD